MDEKQKPKRTKHRSPNYPAIHLGTAVELANSVYRLDRLQQLPIHVAHVRLGYKAGGSSGNQSVAAFISFGLAETVGTGSSRRFGLTDRARRICLGSSDRPELLRECALLPSIHKKIWERYRGEIPQDDVLRHFLLFENTPSFNDESVDRFIAEFRNTIEFAKLSKDTIVGSDGTTEDLDNEDDLNNSLDSNSARENVKDRVGGKDMTVSGGTRELKFYLPSGEAVIHLPKQMQHEDFEALSGYFEIFKKAVLLNREEEPKE